MFLIPESSLQLQLLNRGLRAPSAGCWFSLLHLISNWLNFLCTELYNCSMTTFFLWASLILLIQPVHGQGNILIILDWMHLFLTQVHSYFDCKAEVNMLHLFVCMLLHLNNPVFYNILITKCLHQKIAMNRLALIKTSKHNHLIILLCSTWLSNKFQIWKLVI